LVLPESAINKEFLIDVCKN